MWIMYICEKQKNTQTYSAQMFVLPSKLFLEGLYVLVSERKVKSLNHKISLKKT